MSARARLAAAAAEWTGADAETGGDGRSTTSLGSQRVRFSTGQERTFVELMYSCSPRAEHAGDEVEVRYLPSDPTDVRFATGPGSSNGSIGPPWIPIALLVLAGAAVVRVAVGCGLDRPRRPAATPAYVPERMAVSPTPALPLASARGTERLAIRSVVLGIAAVPLFPLAVVGVAAVASGVVALSRIGRSGNRGRARAVVGVVLGAVSIAAFALMVLGMVVGDDEARSGRPVATEIRGTPASFVPGVA